MKSTLLILALISLPALAEIQNFEFDAVGIEVVKIENGSGDVTVKAGEGDKALVAANKLEFDKSCKLIVEKAADKLIVKTEQEKGFFSKSNCRVNFDILVPAATALDIDNGSGDVAVFNTNKNLTFRLGSGDLNINALLTKLDGKLGSGDVNLTGTVASADLTTGSGDVVFKYTTAPKGDLSIKTGSGDLQLLLPKDAKVQAKFSTGSGELKNEFGSVENADFKVVAKSGSGDLTIKKSAE